MPSNSTGWIWHSLARETGRLGHLHSPGHERGPWPWFPYAFDNGCYGLWNPEQNTFDDSRWSSHGAAEWRRLMFWGQSAAQPPLWAIVPDRPGDWNATVAKWSEYAAETPFPLAVAVQDGATVDAVRSLFPAPYVIAVGGSTDWKWATVEMWLAEFPRVHVLRVNAPTKLARLEQLGCMSCDGTGWNRGDRVMTRGLEEWARMKPKPIDVPLWPHACRAPRRADRKQITFAA